MTGRSRSTVLPTVYGLLCASIFLGIDASVAGVVIRPFDIAFALLLAAQLFMSGRPTFRRIVLPPFVWLLLLVMIIEVVNGLFLNSVAVAIKETLQNTEQMLFLLVLASLLTDIENREKFLKAFLIGISLIALGTVLYYFSQGNFVRFKGLGEPKYTFGIISILLLVRVIHQRSRSQWIWVAAFVAAILLTLASGERKGWAALIFAGGVVTLLSILLGRGGVAAIRMMIVVGLAVPAALFAVTLASDRSTAYIDRQIEGFGHIGSLIDADHAALAEMETNISNRVRVFVTKRSLEYISENPVFGLGTQKLKDTLGENYHFLPDQFIRGAHNEYLRYGAENGIPSMVFYAGAWMFLVLAAIVISARSSVRHRAIDVSILGLATYGAIASMLMGGGASQMMLLLIPMSMAIGTMTERRNLQRRAATRAVAWGAVPRGAA